MSKMLPHRPAVEDAAGDPNLVPIDDSGPVVEVLQSEVARSLLDGLYEEPATASDLADRVGTSLQNVQYHLGRLQEADLVTVAGTWYSEKGLEMDVYAPTGPLVLVAGSADRLGAVERAVDDPRRPSA